MKNKKLLTTMAAIASVCLSGAVLASCDVLNSLGGHTHNLIKVEGVEASCLTEGQEEYYACVDCGLIYSDSEGKNELETPVIIKATGHTPSGEATCSQSQTCSECNAILSAALGHTLIEVKAKANTCTENGNIAHWTCEACGGLFGDANGEKVLNTEEVVIPAMHTFGAELSYDGNEHYYKCDYCPERKDPVSHDLKNDSDHINHWQACDCGYTTKKEAHETSTIEATLVTSVFIEGNSLTANDVEVKGLCSCGKNFIVSDVTIEENVLVAGENVIKVFAAGHEATVTVEVESMADRLVHFAPAKETNLYFEGTEGTTDGRNTMKVQMVTHENGLPATKFTFNQNTRVNDTVTTYNNASGAGGRNTRLPLVANEPRTVVLYATNYGDETVSFRFGIVDGGKEYAGVDVTVEAGKTVSVAFIAIKSTSTPGNNFQFTLKSKVSKETSIGVYGFFHSGSDIESISVSKQPTKTTFHVGEKFTAKGMILNPTGINYGEVYVYTNYKTDIEDGYVFTEDDIGTKKVKVTFAGKECTYNINVEPAEEGAHDHVLELVDKVDPVKCTTNGAEAHYKCTVAGCNAIFADADGEVELEKPVAISCHNAGTVLPGEEIVCSDCNNKYGETLSEEGWVRFRPETNIYNNKMSGLTMNFGDVDGVSGTLITIKAGTKANSSFEHTSWGNNGAGTNYTVQTYIPNAVNDANARKVIMYYHNYGSEAITLKYENNTDNAYDLVTIPAGGVVVSSFINTNLQYGANWFIVSVLNDVQSDAQIGVYGYFFIEESEMTGVSVSTKASDLTFKVGETFSSDGLILKANGSMKSTFVESGYTTNYDGYTFTAKDVGTQTVTVTFAGVTTTYTITVEA